MLTGNPESAQLIGASQQKQRFIAKMSAKLKTSLLEGGPTRRDTDLIDHKQIQENWIDSDLRCAPSTLQEPNLIKSDAKTRVSPS